MTVQANSGGAFTITDLKPITWTFYTDGRLGGHEGPAYGPAIHWRAPVVEQAPRTALPSVEPLTADGTPKVANVLRQERISRTRESARRSASDRLDRMRTEFIAHIERGTPAAVWPSDLASLVQLIDEQRALPSTVGAPAGPFAKWQMVHYAVQRKRWGERRALRAVASRWGLSPTAARKVREAASCGDVAGIEALAAMPGIMVNIRVMARAFRNSGAHLIKN